MKRLTDLLARFQRSHAGRAWQANGSRRGPVLAGGIAYAALFSVFGAVVAGFSVFGLVLGSNGPLFDAVVKAVDDTLPGLLDVPAGDGVIEPASLVDPNLVSVTGAVAFVTAVLAGLGWIGALREGVRAVAGMPPLQRNPVVAKLVDVGVLATLGLAVLTAAVLSIGTGSAASWLLRLIGLEGGPIASALLRGAALLVVAVAYALILLVVYRPLAGLHLPWVRMRPAVLVGGAVLALLTHLSGLLAGSAGSRNPLLATGAVLVGLLVLLNLISRIMLLAACWVVTLEDPLAVLEHGPPEALDLTKDTVRPSQRAARIAAIRPTYGQRAADRTTLAAGLVLGAAVVVTGRVLRQGAGSLVDLVRGR